MSRKKKHEEHVNHERWLVSYADFITLLFAFFVVMYAVSQVDTKKMKDVVGSVRFAMHFAGTGGSGKMPIFEGRESDLLFSRGEPAPGQNAAASYTPGSEDSMIETAQPLRLRSSIQKAIRQAAASGEGIPEDVVQFTVSERGLRVRITAAFLFDPGGTRLRPDAIPVVDAIARIIKPLEHEVRIEGHTDAKGGEGKLANWRLSSERALAMVEYFVSGFGIDPGRLSSTAYAEYRPIASNETEEGRALNRRIELFILTKRTYAD